MWVVLTMLVLAAILFGYFLIERRINHKACAGCGYRVSLDALPEVCPRCGSTID